MRQGKPVISVIVPIYKVEEYLDECIQSIVNQTYTNLEIILIDDGSPDSCPQKCELWSKKDERIKVFHKKNGGLSSARNMGLDVASGEYIGFVDSDDCIFPDMYESLLSSLIKVENSCAIANGRIISYKDGCKSVYKEKWNIKENRIISYQDFAIETILTNVGFTVWSKLYKKDIIKEIRFKEGKNNEDTLFMFELSKKLEEKKLGMIDISKDVYCYRIRENSICTSSIKPLEIDVIENFNEIYKYYCSKNDLRAIKIEIKRNCILTQLITKLLSNKRWEKEYWNDWYPELKKIPLKSMRPTDIGLKLFVDFVIHKYMPFISKFYLHRKYNI